MKFRYAVVLLVCALAIVHAQSVAPIPKFEAVSIKPCSLKSSGIGRMTVSPGRFTMNCRTVSDLIRQSYITFAYGSVLNLPANPPPIEKGPTWISTDLYTIEAKAEGTPDQGTMFGAMMRALLGDRFQLKLHSEAREVPVYDLTVAKSGAKLQPAHEGACRPLDVDHPPPPPVPGQPLQLICGIARITPDGFDVRGVTMAELGRALRLDRPVIDKTGVAGTFDFPLLSAANLQGAPPPPPPPPPPGSAPMPQASSMADAVDTFVAIQSTLQKFGLKLESAKGPGEFLVIDHIERPSEN
jgi:uncharacterized protein (TIGR03435 family)